MTPAHRCCTWQGWAEQDAALLHCYLSWRKQMDCFYCLINDLTVVNAKFERLEYSVSSRIFVQQRGQALRGAMAT